MIRRWLPFSLLVLVGLVVRADDPKPGAEDPPVRLKKKKPATAVEQPKDEKKDEKKDDKKDDDKTKDDLPKPEPGPGAREDEKEVLERIARNMKAVEDRLVNKELNEGTKQLQDDIVKDIESLIQMAENPPPSPSPQSNSGMPPPDNDGKSGQDQQPNPMNNPMNKGGMNENMNPMSGGNDPRTQTRDPREPPPPDDDRSNGRIALRETKRTQAKTEGSNGESLPKYQDLIQAYRKNLSRQKDSP